MAVQRESEIQKACLDFLHLQGCMARKVNSTGIPDAKSRSRFRNNPNAGISDIIACLKGQLLCIEIKREGGKLRPDQTKFMKEVLDSGAEYWIVHSVDELILDWQSYVAKLKR